MPEKYKPRPNIVNQVRSTALYERKRKAKLRKKKPSDVGLQHVEYLGIRG